MKLWKKVLSAATAGVLCLGSVGVTGLKQVALADYVETTPVLTSEDTTDSNILKLGIGSMTLTLDELKAINYCVTLSVTSNREFNTVGVGVRMGEGLRIDYIVLLIIVLLLV